MMGKIIFKQRGAISIFLAVLLLSELLVIGLGISFLAVSQLKMSGQTGNSVVAYYAAESGAERCLYEARKGTDECPFSDVALDISSECTYTTTYTTSTDMANITSFGQFKETSRKVELAWAL